MNFLYAKVQLVSKVSDIYSLEKLQLYHIRMYMYLKTQIWYHWCHAIG